MSNRISGLLSITFIGLCAVIFMEIRSGVPSGENLRASSGAIHGSDVEGPLGLTLPPLAALDETLARPLFDEDRRPAGPESTAVATVAASVSKPALGNFTVSAIVITNSDRAVLLTHPQSGALTRVAEGETISGWLLEKVEADRATFTRDGEVLEVELRSFGPPPPRRPQRSAATRPGLNPPERDLRRVLGGNRKSPPRSQEDPDSDR